VPTDEQIPIIQAPLAPSVVIAGAGSGKTETMSQRVLYLVANSIITPDQLLGLTFTRKAAGDLAKRIKYRLKAAKECQFVA
jgi:DNA helicase II / ATP-dependent DNA helicase PcrA